MNPVTPGKGRAKIVTQGRDMLIEIPARTNIFRTAFLGFWLCGWTIAELVVLGTILAGNIHPFLLAWFCAWTVGGAFAISTFLWGLAGRERIWITDDGVKIERSIPIWSRDRIYDGARISRLRSAIGFGTQRFGREQTGLTSSFDKARLPSTMDAIRCGSDWNWTRLTRAMWLRQPAQGLALSRRDLPCS